MKEKGEKQPAWVLLLLSLLKGQPRDEQRCSWGWVKPPATEVKAILPHSAPTDGLQKGRRHSPWDTAQDTEPQKSTIVCSMRHN